MRLLASFACSALVLLGGCILVYDPGDFQIDDGGNGGSGNGGSGGSGGPVCSPQDQLNGAKVTAPPNQSTWVPVPEAKCRNGSSTGFGIRINPNSTKLVIFFDGAGACFNAASCAANASSFGSTDFTNLQNTSGNTGMADPANPANPVRDWNGVYIPYCTGDLHAGSNASGDVPSGGPVDQAFVGFDNVGHYMARIVPTFPGLTEVLVAGNSAGGFGALFNYDRIARDFCPVPVVLIDDSGPPMSDGYFAPCLQDRLRMLWGVDANIPADCPTAMGQNGGDMVNLITCLGDKYASGRLGIIASNNDSENTKFYGFGQDCMNLDTTTPTPMPPATYAAGLMELRSVYMHKSTAWGSYFKSSTEHTYLGGDSFYTTTVSGVLLTDWVRDMVNSGPSDVGP